MATINHQFTPAAAVLPAGGYAQHKVIDGAEFPLHVLTFGSSEVEAIYFIFRAISYGSGDLTLDIDWYADTAFGGNIVWSAAIGVITPDVDAQDIETKTLAAAQSVVDSHLGVTGQQLHRTSIPISVLDGLAAEDFVVVKIWRDGISANDTMQGDALLTLVTLSYSDS